VKTIKHYK